ncbi:unnamed protein product, partial [Brassica oleracea var. botrytis]
SIHTILSSLPSIPFFISLQFQVSFLLGVIPVFIAWIYSEFLEYKRSSLHSKVLLS